MAILAKNPASLSFLANFIWLKSKKKFRQLGDFGDFQWLFWLKMDLEDLTKQLPRSRSLPQVYPLKLKLIQSDSIQSNGSVFGFNKDSGIVDENHSGISVGVIPVGLEGIVGEDYASQGSGMLASEPQSEVDLPENDPMDQNGSNGSGPKVESEKSSLKLVMLDKKMNLNIRTLKQHYYAEGGWGWIIVLVTLCVQMISHGLQVNLAMYLMAVPKSSIISRRLLNGSVEQSGKNTVVYY